MASKLLLGLSCLLLICAVYAGDGVYIRGKQRGSYTVDGVGGTFNNEPGQHTYVDEQGNGYVHENGAAKESKYGSRQDQDYSPSKTKDQGFWSQDHGFAPSAPFSNGNRPSAASPLSPSNESIMPKAKYLFVHKNNGAGATHIVDGPGIRVTNLAKSSHRL